MARSRRRRPQPITDRITRVYEVILWPDESPDGPYTEPVTVNLSWPADKVPDLYTDKVKRDALKQARKEEIKAGRLDEDSPTVFALESIRFVKTGFIRAVDTLEYKRANNITVEARWDECPGPEDEQPLQFKVGDKLVLRNGRFEPA